MKVWVTYESFPYEGCSAPLAVFSSEEAAKRWMDELAKSEYSREWYATYKPSQLNAMRKEYLKRLSYMELVLDES